MCIRSALRIFLDWKFNKGRFIYGHDLKFHVHIHGPYRLQARQLVYTKATNGGVFQTMVYRIQNGIFNCTTHTNIIALPRDNIWKLPRLTHSATTWNTETAVSNRLGPLWRKGDEWARGWTTCRGRGGEKGRRINTPDPKYTPHEG
jgi:hypothetical protein